MYTSESKVNSYCSGRQWSTVLTQLCLSAVPQTRALNTRLLQRYVPKPRILSQSLLPPLGLSTTDGRKETGRTDNYQNNGVPNFCIFQNPGGIWAGQLPASLTTELMIRNSENRCFPHPSTPVVFDTVSPAWLRLQHAATLSPATQHPLRGAWGGTATNSAGGERKAQKRAALPAGCYRPESRRCGEPSAGGSTVGPQQLPPHGGRLPPTCTAGKAPFSR